MNRCLLAVAALTVSLAAPLGHAQTSAPPNSGDPFKDTSMLKPPAGARVAIIEFEDMECPACARAFPVVHAAVDHYKIPFLRHDWPIHQVWAFDAAVDARYLQDRVSPSLAEQYRRELFAAQTGIASKDDFSNFTQRFFRNHGTPMPFVFDPQGTLTAQVKADANLALKIGLVHTPTILVVTPRHWVQVTDPNLLYQTIDAALAETSGPAPRHR